MKLYQNIVSLGYFCSPAMEFERLQLRSFSLPFDWLITRRLSQTLDLIDADFADFLDEEYLFQFRNAPHHYRNEKWGIDFYHDFSPFCRLDEQLESVRSKYQRRIRRFYQVIQQPTLFLRYLNINDFAYVNENYEDIVAKLKKHHPQNAILFVANVADREHLRTDLPIYYVEPDENDGVARTFLDANEALKTYILESVEPAATQKPQITNKTLPVWKKAWNRLRIRLKLVYKHHQQC